MPMPHNNLVTSNWQTPRPRGPAVNIHKTQTPYQKAVSQRARYPAAPLG
jgi:hypothetical protein